MSWTSHPPEDVAVDGLNLADLRVYVAGERVTPADTLFVTSLYSLPYQMVDVFSRYVLHAGRCGAHTSWSTRTPTSPAAWR